MSATESAPGASPGPPPGPPPGRPPRPPLRSSAATVPEPPREPAPSAPVQAPLSVKDKEKMVGAYCCSYLLYPAREHNQFYQQLEIDRVLMVAFRMNPYDVLDVTYEANEKDIQRVFRKKSLLLHPDKVTDDVERAKEAFELLKDAASLLQDETKRQRLDETVRSARSLALKELGLSMRMDQLEIEKEQAPGGKLHDIVPSFSDRIKRCTKQLMLDDELEKRRSIRLKQEAEFEARRQRDQAEEVLKRKAEVEQEWESSRENRVQGWRSFQKGSSKKKKKHTNVLG